LYKSTGSFTSQIATATALTQWRTFTTEDTLPTNTTIDYYIRTATSVYNIAGATWQSITPGSVISTITANNYVQWSATFTTTDSSVTPLLDVASVGWATGDASKSVMKGINYKSRYWLAGSTSLVNDYNDMVLVESKSPLGTYTRYNLPLSAMAIWNGNLYGAIGNTSKIARVDYGSTDDGTTITSYWSSRDEIYDNPIFYKTVNTVILDYANSPANTGLSIGLSPDFGTTYTNRTVNASASTLIRNTKKLNYPANTSLGFRTRIFNNVSGIGFKIYGLHNMGTLTEFYGN
jgi:hypothetical protein